MILSTQQVQSYTDTTRGVYRAVTGLLEWREGKGGLLEDTV